MKPASSKNTKRLSSIILDLLFNYGEKDHMIDFLKVVSQVCFEAECITLVVFSDFSHESVKSLYSKGGALSDLIGA